MQDCGLLQCVIWASLPTPRGRSHLRMRQQQNRLQFLLENAVITRHKVAPIRLKSKLSLLTTQRRCQQCLLNNHTLTARPYWKLRALIFKALLQRDYSSRSQKIVLIPKVSTAIGKTFVKTLFSLVSIKVTFEDNFITKLCRCF